ncbi:MAG TPA: hypothetical protein V6D25_04455 [Leptolyngbyaceae cyanobacterium]
MPKLQMLMRSLQVVVQMPLGRVRSLRVLVPELQLLGRSPQVEARKRLKVVPLLLAL